MSGLVVVLNGTQLAAVSSEGFNVLSVRVHGDLVTSEFACVDVSGGLYGEGENGKHLIWVNDRVIAPGDEVEVALLKSVAMSHAGKTIDELFPAAEEPMGPWPPIDRIFRELSRQPKVRDRFSFNLVTPEGEFMSSSTLCRDHRFVFSILWNWQHPERVRVSLSSNSIDNIEKRTDGTDHANFFLRVGQRVKLRVDV